MILFAIFLLLCLSIGLAQSRKSTTFESYALSKGKFSSFVITCTIIASFTGGGSILGTIEKSQSTGFYAFCALIGFFVQLIIVGIYIPKNIERFKGSLTIGDILDTAYKPWLKKITSVLWLIFSFGILSIQIKGMANILAGYSGLSISTSAIVSGIILVAYCAFGGIRAVIYTDVIQLIAMFIILPLILYYIIFHRIGVETFSSSLKFAFFEQPIGWDKTALTSAFFGFIAGDAFIPPVIQRFLMAKNGKQVKFTFLLGSFGFLFLILIASLIGITLTNIPLTMSETPISTMINYLSSEMRIIASLGLFAVVISSADTYLNATASNIVKDLFGIKSLKLCQIVTITIGIMAIISAAYMSNLFDMLLFFYKFWGPIIVVPIFALLIGKKISNKNLKLCMVLSVIVISVWNFYGLEKSTGISDLVIGLVFSISTFLIFNKRVLTSVKA